MSEDRAALEKKLAEALAAERKGDYPEARRQLRELLGQATEWRGLHVQVLLALGRLLVAAGPPSHDEAAQLLGTAEAISKEDGLTGSLATAVHLRALLEINQGRYKEAGEWLDKSPARTLSAGKEAAQWHHYSGLLASRKGDTTAAENAFVAACELYRNAIQDEGMAQVWDSMANLLLRKGSTRAALPFAEASLGAKEKLGDLYGQAISHGTLGRIHMLLGEHDAAVGHFEADLALCGRLGDSRGETQMRFSLGRLALLRGEPEKAEAWHSQNRVSGNVYADLRRLQGLIEVSLSKNDVAGAERYCAELEGLVQSGLMPELLTVLKGFRGTLEHQKGNHAAAEKLLLEVLGTTPPLFPMDAIPFWFALRDCYRDQGQNDKAVEAAAKLLDLLLASGAEDRVAEVESWLREVDREALTRLVMKAQLPGPVVETVLQGSLVDRKPASEVITVLFSDVRDYTTLSEELTAAETVAILNEWFAEVTRIVHEHDGLVDKFMGDGVMALFGVARGDSDGAADAVRAALDMRAALLGFNRRRRMLGKKELRAGFGIHTGEAVVGFIGSHLRRSFTAIGDTVNTAARIEAATKEHGCDILISGETDKSQAKDAVAETVFAAEAMLKGKKKAVSLYRVAGLRSVPPA